MKQIELELKKKILIVEAPEGELTAIGNDDEVYYAIKNDETYIKIVDGKKWKLLCKGSELTEEIARGFQFKNIRIAHNGEHLSAIEEFKFHINNNGYYWGENPIYFDDEESDFDKRHEMRINWEKAESKAFNPEKTLIFEILL